MRLQCLYSRAAGPETRHAYAIRVFAWCFVAAVRDGGGGVEVWPSCNLTGRPHLVDNYNTSKHNQTSEQTRYISGRAQNSSDVSTDPSPVHKNVCKSRVEQTAPRKYVHYSRHCRSYTSVEHGCNVAALENLDHGLRIPDLSAACLHTARR